MPDRLGTLLLQPSISAWSSASACLPQRDSMPHWAFTCSVRSKNHNKEKHHVRKEDYSELLNSLDSGATTKITINNRRLNRTNFEQSILMPMRGDACDVYRREYNQMLLDKATGANGIIQEKYITVSVCKKDIEEARTYFARIGADLIAHFAALGSKCTELDAAEKLRVLHDFYRQGEEVAFHFDPQDMMRKGHDFMDYICPDSMEKSSDCLKLGEKYCRVLFLKDYASYPHISLYHGQPQDRRRNGRPLRF